MIKRIKQMNKGMFRLLTCLFPVWVLTAFVVTPVLLNNLVSNRSQKMNFFDSIHANLNSIFVGDGKLFLDSCLAVFLAALIYWPLVRLCLWIYDGFMSDKQNEKK